MPEFNSYRARFERDRRNWKGIEGIDATWQKWRRVCAAMEKRGIEELSWRPEEARGRIALARVLDRYVGEICHNLREGALLIAGAYDDLGRIQSC